MTTTFPAATNTGLVLVYVDESSPHTIAIRSDERAKIVAWLRSYPLTTVDGYAEFVDPRIPDGIESGMHSVPKE